MTPEFFSMLGERMGPQVLLIAALEPGYNSSGGGGGGGGGGNRLVAGALNLVGDKALFGRNWGCTRGDSLKALHFELCYYQALEHAIELGLEVRAARALLPFWAGCQQRTATARGRW